MMVARAARRLLLGASVLCMVTWPAGAPATAAAARVLRVCADPNNLPFSNRTRAGFENAIAELVASELGATLEYTFWAQRRGFFRNTLNAGLCDVVIGVPSSLDMLRTTRPYYRARHVFVSRRSRALHLRALTDPALRGLRIGIQVVGDELAGTPPAHALARHGLVDNVVGFTVTGDYARESPLGEIFTAVRSGDVDVAVVWGPLAALLHDRNDAADPLVVSPVRAARDGGIPLEFAISMGVRKSDRRLQRELDRLIVRRASAIDAILTRHGVPHQPAVGGVR
jgi:mxaJ protein